VSRHLWVENYLGVTLNEFQRSAVDLLCSAMRCGPYDFKGTFDRANWKKGYGVSFVIKQPLATIDSDGLTRLVVGAHDRMIRVEVEGCGPGMLRVSMWPRAVREGELHKRCPTIEDAVASIRPQAVQPQRISDLPAAIDGVPLTTTPEPWR
jgi:hypothetical protein